MYVFLTFFILILIVNSLHSAADGGQYLVRNGVKNIAQRLNRQVFAEDFYGVAFLAVDVGYIYHGYIHADVAHILCLLSVDQTVGMAIAQMTVQAVGITDRNGGDDAVSVEDGLATVAHAIPSLDVVHLQDGGLQGAHAVDGLIVA